MKNKIVGFLALLLSLGMIAGSPSFAGTPSFSNRLLNTSHNTVLAVASVAPSKPAASTSNGLKPNWAWTTTVNVYGYTQMNGNPFILIWKSVDKVVITSDTKGFSWAATWNRPWYVSANRVKWSIPNVPVNKSYRVTAYDRDGSQKWTLVYVSKPLFVASDYQVPTDFVFNY